LKNGTLLAAVDLGSNSFRLEIGRYADGLIERVDYLRETVRLGGALDAHRVLSEEAMESGWSCLARFGERLRRFSKGRVRAVATQTLREARNSAAFLGIAQQRLGFAIEVISGIEEARLTFAGVTHMLPNRRERRLVFDIGGRSTEVILGRGSTPHDMESYRVGSVSWTRSHFPDGACRRAHFDKAITAAEAVFDQGARQFAVSHWDTAYGSSGTIGAAFDLAHELGLGNGLLTRRAVDAMIKHCAEAGDVQHLQLPAVRADRLAVLPGGLSVLRAVMGVYGINELRQAQGALRHGMLFDLISRQSQQSDVRVQTVLALCNRFQVDRSQGKRVKSVATNLAKRSNVAVTGDALRCLGWACELHEAGAIVSHTEMAKHGAYLLANVDAPGFTMEETAWISALVRGQRGKLKAVAAWLADPVQRCSLLCLRLATVVCHHRQAPEAQAMSVAWERDRVTIRVNLGWAERNPQSWWLLNVERMHWAKVGVDLRLEAQQPLA